MKRSLLSLICLLLCFVVFPQSAPLEAYEEKVPGTGINFKLVPIPAGVFLMGSPENEKGRGADEGPQRKIQLSAFWMQTMEVTHDQFLVFFDDEQLSRNSEVDAVTRPTPQYIDLSWGMGKQGGYPANSMSQHTALMYCRWLYQKTGTFYRLPTEAEWEYACRAGSKEMYPWGSNIRELDKYAWHAGNSDSKYHQTGTKQPNVWGLYDMLGNVSEWTVDQYSEKYFESIQDGTADPVITASKRYPRSVRGGSFEDKAEAIRCAARFKSESSWNKRDPQVPKSKWWLTDAAFVGFRVVKPLKQPTAEEANAFYNSFSSK